MRNRKLSARKEAAIALVLTGMTDGEVGERVGVTRQCVSRWRHEDIRFMEELEGRRSELREKHMDAINNLVMKAVQVVQEALESEDEKTRLKAAALVLKTCGLEGYLKAGQGMTKTKEELEKEMIIAGLEEALPIVYKMKKISLN